MKRLMLAVLLVVFLSMAVPPLRERAMPKYRAAGGWVWGVLDGPLSPVITPWRRIQTKSEMSRIATLLITSRNRGFPPPTTQELPQFMLRGSLDSTATDHWGSPYVVGTKPDTVYIRSAGPDLQYDTEDDILAPVRYPSPSRRRGTRR